MSEIKEQWLSPTEYIDFETSLVQNFIKEHTSPNDTPKEKLIKLYYVVRDKIYYNPYCVNYQLDIFKASTTVKNLESFCIPKTILFCACARALGFPARIGFADVKNHLATKRLNELLRTNVYRMHGYTLIYIHDKWVKATPVFNIELCEKFGVEPLAFDGAADSILHAFNQAGDRHMEYLHDYGGFDDMPVSLLIKVYMTHYPHLFTPEIKALIKDANFYQDVEEEMSQAKKA